MKVRKDFNLTMPSSSGNSWNSILCGGAQSGMLATAFQYFYGNSVTPVSVAVGSLDPTASTGLAQWNNFYNRLICLGSKIVVDVLNIGAGASDDVSLITLVPTINYNLASGSGATAFDAAGIDPGELPYAKRLVLKGAYSQGGGLTRIKNYCKIKKMLGVKDMEDVTPNGGATVSDGPYIPTVSGNNWLSLNGNGADQQPNAGTGINTPRGVYWNLVFQNMLQNATIDATGGTTYSPSITIRVQLTSYVMLTDRIPLQTI